MYKFRGKIFNFRYLFYFCYEFLNIRSLFRSFGYFLFKNRYSLIEFFSLILIERVLYDLVGLKLFQ